MPALLIIALIVGVVLLVTGIVSAALKVLLFIGLVLIVLAVIGWILRRVRGGGSRVSRPSAAGPDRTDRRSGLTRLLPCSGQQSIFAA